jgi:hypothetical protein
MADPEPAPARPAPPPARGPLLLATVSLVMAAASLLAIVRAGKVVGALEGEMQALGQARAEVDRTSARLSHSVEVLGSAVTLLSDEQVDLGNGKLQHLRHGFAVSELQTEREDSGVRVTGRLINAGTLKYRAATFRIKADTSSAEFTIDTLAPGGSGAFSALLARVPLEAARVATLSFLSAAVEYAH